MARFRRHMSNHPPSTAPNGQRTRGGRGSPASNSIDERLHLAIDAVGLGTWDWDLRTGAIVWAGHHAQVMGLSDEAFDGRYETFARAVHPDDLPGIDAALAHARNMRSVYENEYRVIWPDGSIHWVAGRGRFFYAEDGRPVRMVGVIQDVTARRTAEERVRAANAERDGLLARLQQMMDQMPIGCVIGDLETRVSYWNSAAERLFGFTQEEVLGRPGYETVIAPAAKPLVEQLVADLAAGTQNIVVVDENITKDGRRILCEWHNSALRDSNGTMVGIISMVQDVTERRQREEQIQRINTDLERRVAERTAELAKKHRELEIFTYSVSHDLKAPLRGIDGYSKLLLEDYAGKLDDEGRFFVETIRSATLQMHTLIDDLLAYSRLERRALQNRLVDVPAVVRSVCGEFEGEITASGTTVELELTPAQLVTEAEGLAQAVRNLLDNALKFSRERPAPRIQVTGVLQEEHYLISIQDNGLGFPPEYRERIFEIFQRLHRAEDYPGTGVGLAIVRKAMERLGGRAWAESEPDKGATFFLCLPTHAQEQP